MVWQEERGKGKWCVNCAIFKDGLFFHVPWLKILRVLNYDEFVTSVLTEHAEIIENAGRVLKYMKMFGFFVIKCGSWHVQLRFFAKSNHCIALGDLSFRVLGITLFFKTQFHIELKSSNALKYYYSYFVCIDKVCCVRRMGIFRIDFNFHSGILSDLRPWFFIFPTPIYIIYSHHGNYSLTGALFLPKGILKRKYIFFV